MWDLLAVVPNWLLPSWFSLGWINWVFYIISGVGLFGLLAAFFMKFVPFISVYRTSIQIISTILLVLGSFGMGWRFNEGMWSSKLAKAQEMIAAAEAKSAQTNTQVETKVVTKTQVIREKGEEVIKYVEREVVKYDSQCVIPPEFITALNKAAK